jgi:uncharacterized protein
MPDDLTVLPLTIDSDDPISRIVQIIIDTIDPDTIILFGSRATEKENPDSDYDICVLKSGIEERRKTSKLLYQALYEVGVPVELLVETPESFNTHKTNPHLIYRDIAKYGKILYEKSG